MVTVDAPPAEAFAPIRRIGGATGWYFADALWRLRGWLDRMDGRRPACPDSGATPTTASSATSSTDGASRRTSLTACLRLSAGLKLPGRGWLEFRVEPLDDGARSLIRQTATFDPRGVAGRLYWYGVLPLHALVFRGLLRRIAELAGPRVGAAHAALPPHTS